jgi:acid phosphatase
MDNDNWQQIPANVSTIADLFDTKGVAWGEYQEGLPYAGMSMEHSLYSLPIEAVS